MKTEIIKAGKYTIKQFGSTHDIVLATIQLFVMIELTFSLGYIHNQLYPPFRSEEDICTTCQCVIMQSWSLVILFGVILFIQQLIKICTLSKPPCLLGCFVLSWHKPSVATTIVLK